MRALCVLHTRYRGTPPIIPQRLPIATAVEDVLLIWSTMDAEEWRNTIRFLPL
jgi:hypothetical protein